jgi:excisionase family DNA binding protein
LTIFDFDLTKHLEARRRQRRNQCPTTRPSASGLRLFTIQEAADVLRIPISWLYERTRKNEIPCRRLGKYVRFTENDLQEIVLSTAAEPRKTARRKG